jgi:hypothetical protein
MTSILVLNNLVFSIFRVFTFQMKKLRELRTMLTQPEIRNYNLLKKLIIVSLTEIFKDILPGYKIRVWSEKEKEQQVSAII